MYCRLKDTKTGKYVNRKGPPVYELADDDGDSDIEPATDQTRSLRKRVVNITGRLASRPRKSARQQNDQKVRQIVSVEENIGSVEQVDGRVKVEEEPFSQQDMEHIADPPANERSIGPGEREDELVEEMEPLDAQEGSSNSPIDGQKDTFPVLEEPPMKQVFIDSSSDSESESEEQCSPSNVRHKAIKQKIRCLFEIGFRRIDKKTSGSLMEYALNKMTTEYAKSTKEKQFMDETDKLTYQKQCQLEKNMEENVQMLNNAKQNQNCASSTIPTLEEVSKVKTENASVLGFLAVKRKEAEKLPGIKWKNDDLKKEIEEMEAVIQTRKGRYEGMVQRYGQFQADTVAAQIRNREAPALRDALYPKLADRGQKRKNNQKAIHAARLAMQCNGCGKLPRAPMRMCWGIFPDGRRCMKSVCVEDCYDALDVSKNPDRANQPLNRICTNCRADDSWHTLSTFQDDARRYEELPA